MSPGEPTEAEITDLIDGRLSGVRRREVEQWLADHPERAQEVERQRHLNEALKDLGAEILEEPVPERLREVLKRAPGRVGPDGDAPQDEASKDDHRMGPAPRRWFGGPVGAIALILVGVLMGWIVNATVDRDESRVDALLADASYAFSFYAGDRDHGIQFPPDQVEEYVEASRKVFAREVDPPDLQGAGLKFRGARIAPIGRRTSSFFFFEDQTGESLTVVFWPESQPDREAPGFRDLGDISAQYWFAKGLAFAVIGETDEERLSEIGEEVVSFYGHDVGS